LTNKSAKKVVIISGIKSDNIEQAIFILKDSGYIPFQKSIVDEADEIIQNYTRAHSIAQSNCAMKKRKWFRRKK